MAVPLTLVDLDRAADAFWTSGPGLGGAWDEFRDRLLPLPDWFDRSLDPLSPEYAAQQDRLWHLISGRSEAYAPEQNEHAPEVVGMDALVRPGFYTLGSEAAADHIIALGHIVKHSGISAGDRVLEFGAGFGQIALTFARLGAVVDTVDINPDFCAAVRAQAKWFEVPLNAFHGHFGYNPRPGQRYKLIVFYEAFHHARGFIQLIRQLREMIDPDGKILLAGEPICMPGDPHVPYPWGIRLAAEAVVVIRKRGWYEIGYQEDFLLKQFIKGGFVHRKHPGVISHYATVYEFCPRPRAVNLALWPLSPSDDVTWHAMEPTGRWTTARSTMTIDVTASWAQLRVSAANFHSRQMVVSFRLGLAEQLCSFEAGERKTVFFDWQEGAERLEITCSPIYPRIYGLKRETRQLGIFVEHLEYMP